jgi:hypothetical protein
MIQTNHDPENGVGSGWLPDYLNALPRLRADRKKAAAIAGLK